MGCGKIVLTIERPRSSLLYMCGLQSMVSSFMDFVMSFCKMTTFDLTRFIEISRSLFYVPFFLIVFPSIVIMGSYVTELTNLNLNYIF